MTDIMYSYDSLVSMLKLYDDPDYKSELFGFDEYKKQMINVIDSVLNIDKQFAICLNGEWGSGKTSLMYRVYKEFEKHSNKDNRLKVIWFDAWKYERLDPVLALLQMIISEYITRSDKLKKFFIGLFSLTAEISSRKALGLTLDEINKHFKNTIKDINTLDEIIEKVIGDGNLLVFIDDLDRCHIDNIIGMLEAIKILFNAKNAKFIVAVDIKKLERAWALKHNNDANAIEEGKEHLDKIFQLKLNLPRKSREEIDAYINEIAERFPEDLRDIVRAGCKANPRKIKRLMNILYAILLGLDDQMKDKFDEMFPCIVIWAIIVTNFPRLADIIRGNPSLFIDSLKRDFEYIKLKNDVELYKADMLKDSPRNSEFSKFWSYIPIYEEVIKYQAEEFCNELFRYINYISNNIPKLLDNLQYIINNTKLFL